MEKTGLDREKTDHNEVDLRNYVSFLIAHIQDICKDKDARNIGLRFDIDCSSFNGNIVIPLIEEECRRSKNLPSLAKCNGKTFQDDVDIMIDIITRNKQPNDNNFSIIPQSVPAWIPVNYQYGYLAPVHEKKNKYKFKKAVKFYKMICDDEGLSSSAKELIISDKNHYSTVIHWKRTPLFLRGSYLKNYRNVSQSPMMITENERQPYLSFIYSVSKIIGYHVANHFNVHNYKDQPSDSNNNNNDNNIDSTNSTKTRGLSTNQRLSSLSDLVQFHAGGREDADVKMMGNGRTFILRVDNAYQKYRTDFEELEIKIQNDTLTPKLLWGELTHFLCPQNYYNNDDKIIDDSKYLQNLEKYKPPTGLVSVKFQEQSTVYNAIGREVYKQLEEEEIHKNKIYHAVLWCDIKLDKLKFQEVLKTNLGGLNGEFLISEDETHLSWTSKDSNHLVVQQKTPARVAHRRAILNRKRHCSALEFVMHDDSLEKKVDQGSSSHEGGTFFSMRITTDAGFYIKEFVHGDFGRCNPSLTGWLSHQVQILQLDVAEIINKEISSTV